MAVKNAPGIQARNAAIARLKDAHPEEWKAYLTEERVSRGLPADPDEAKKEKRIRSLLDQLGALGYDPNNQ
jgi:hypothetical protein